MNKIIFLSLDLLGITIISLLSFGVFPISDGLIVSYIFLVTAALMQLAPIFLSYRLKDTAYKASLHTASGIYFIIQLIVSFLGYTLLRSSLVFIITTSMMLLLLSIATLLVVMQMGVSGDTIKQKEKTKVFFIDTVICTLEKIKTQTKESELIDTINNVIEKARYSNLNSPTEAAQTETKIIEEIETIENLISTSKIRDCKASCEKLVTLFSEREMLCKLYK